MGTEITVYWRDEEACYASQYAPGRGNLDRDPHKAIEFLRKIRPDLPIPTHQEWQVYCDGTYYVEIPAVFWACGTNGACNANGWVAQKWQVPGHCSECGSPVGHHEGGPR